MLTIYLHELLYTFVSVLSEERLEGLHPLCRKESVAIPTVIIIVGMVVVIDIAQRKEHFGTSLCALIDTYVRHCHFK